MPISIPEFITYCAFAVRHLRHADIAIAARNNGQILGVAQSTRVGARDISTPIVNLLQNTAGLAGQYYICTTLAPTEACLGITKLRRASFIYEFTVAGFRRRELPGAPPWNNLQVPPGNLPVADNGQANGPVLNLDNLVMAPGTGADARSFASAVKLSMHLPPPASTIRDNVFSTQVAGRMAAPAALVVPLAPFTAGAFTPLRHRLFMYLAHAIVAARAMRGGAGAGHSIGAVLTNGNAQIEGYAVNNVTVNSTLHAETLVVMQYGATNGYAGLPANGRLYTTLQSCHMCAGFLATAGLNFEVRYAQTDPIMNNNALARAVNGCSERQQDTANVGTQVMAAVGRGNHQITNVLNSQVGTVFSMEAVHAYRALRHYVNGLADTALWQQGRDIINGIAPGLVV